MNFSFALVLPIAVFAISLTYAFKRICDSNPACAFLAVLLYSALSKSISVIYLDFTNTYITESDATSGNSFAWLYFVLANILIFATAVAVIRFLDGKRSSDFMSWRYSGRQAILAQSLCWLVLLLHLLNIALSNRLALPGTPITRFNFWDNVALPLDRVFGVLMIFVPLCSSALAAHGSRLRDVWVVRNGLLLFFTYLLVLVFEGQRFHGLLLGMSLGFGCLYLVRRAEGQAFLSARGAQVALVGLLALWVLLVREFEGRGLSSYAGGAYNAIVYRVLALQGHTVWSAFSLYFESGPTWEFRNLLTGLEFIMQSTGRTSVVEAYVDRGVNFATALPAGLILVSGIPGLLIGSIAYGALYGLIVVAIVRSVRRGEILSCGFLAYVWMAVHSIYSQASLQPFFEPVPWIGLALYWISAVFIRSAIPKKRVLRLDHGRMANAETRSP